MPGMMTVARHVIPASLMVKSLRIRLQMYSESLWRFCRTTQCFMQRFWTWSQPFAQEGQPGLISHCGHLTNACAESRKLVGYFHFLQVFAEREPCLSETTALTSVCLDRFACPSTWHSPCSSGLIATSGSTGVSSSTP